MEKEDVHKLMRLLGIVPVAREKDEKGTGESPGKQIENKKSCDVQGWAAVVPSPTAAPDTLGR